jgi:hypothetical protein
VWVAFSFDLNSPPLVEDPERFYQSGAPFFLYVHFLSREKKTNQKKPPVSRFTLRVVATAGARGNSPVYRRVQTVRVLLSVRIADARRGTKGMNPKTPKAF